MAGLDDAPHQITASMHLAAAKILVSRNKHSTSGASNSCSLSKRTIEIPAVRHISRKNTDEVACAIGFRNRLLATRLSVLAEACQVLFLSAILFFDGRSLRPQIMVGWARERPSLGESAFPPLTIACEGIAAAASLRL
jgi:hypothetical protein